MNRRTICIITVLACAVVCPGRSLGLDLGDTAPPLSIAEWVRGDPIDLTKGKGEKVYLVEFWAVWCPPCKVSIPRLTELQLKYKKDLVIVGVTAPDSRGNSAAAVRKFVKKQGDAMQYAVALDKFETSTNAYMRAANIMGIPYAFLVARDGKIAWMGSPLDPALDGVVAQVISGDYDVRAARIEAQVQRILPMVFRYIQMGQPTLALEGLKEILALDPGHRDALNVTTSIFVDQLRDREAFRSWAGNHLEANKNKPKVLVSLADSLCRISDLEMAVPDLALSAAVSAYQNGSRSDPGTIAVYARANYQIGRLDKAISLQQDALAAADGEDQVGYQNVLDHYTKCKQLQSEN